MPRFFMEALENTARSVTVTGQDARHIACSLRMRQGDRLTLCNGRGTDFDCEIAALSPEAVQLKVVAASATAAEPQTKVTLYQGLPKGDKLEWIIQKAVELGVARIVPVVTSRSIARPGDKAQKKQERWQKIADEAAGQCGRGILPPVEPPLDFAAAAVRMAAARTVVFYECGGAPLRALLNPPPRELSVFIGPEGGIAPDEMETLTAGGAAAATLGKRILRCETAPIAALAAIMTLTGDLE